MYVAKAQTMHEHWKKEDAVVERGSKNTLVAGGREHRPRWKGVAKDPNSNHPLVWMVGSLTEAAAASAVVRDKDRRVQ